MSEPVFLLQIVTPEGAVVRLPGGGLLERDLISAIVNEIVAKWDTSAMEASVTTLVESTRWTMRKPSAAIAAWQVDRASHLRSAVEVAVREAFRELKWQTRHV